MKNLLLLLGLLGSLQAAFAQSEFTYHLFGEGVGFTDGEDAFETSDGGYLLIGSKGQQNLNNSQNPWIIKLDKNAQVEWEREVSFTGSGWWDISVTGVELNDGYVILGSYADTASFGDFSSLIKLDKQGKVVWTKALQEGQATAYGGITPVGNEGHFVLGGMTRVQNYNRIGMARFDGDGNVIWKNIYQTAGLSGALPFTGDLTTTPDGGLLLTSDATGNALLLKTDADGNLLWHNSFAPTSTGLSVRVLNDGKILALTAMYNDGSTLPYNFDYLVLLDEEGVVIHETLFDDSVIEGVNDMTIDGAGNVYIVGNNYGAENSVVLKTDRFGEVIWSKTFGGPDSLIVGQIVRSIYLTKDNHLVIAGGGMIPINWGGFTSTPGYLYFGKMKLDDAVSETSEETQSGVRIEVFPVPARENVRFVSKGESFDGSYLQLFNAQGALVRQVEFIQNSVELLRNGLPGGVYAWRVVSRDEKWLESGKVIFE